MLHPIPQPKAIMLLFKNLNSYTCLPNCLHIKVPLASKLAVPIYLPFCCDWKTIKK